MLFVLKTKTLKSAFSYSRLGCALVSSGGRSHLRSLQAHGTLGSPGPRPFPSQQRRTAPHGTNSHAVERIFYCVVDSATRLKTKDFTAMSASVVRNAPHRHPLSPGKFWLRHCMYRPHLYMTNYLSKSFTFIFFWCWQSLTYLVYLILYLILMCINTLQSKQRITIHLFLDMLLNWSTLRPVERTMFKAVLYNFYFSLKDICLSNTHEVFCQLNRHVLILYIMFFYVSPLQL